MEIPEINKRIKQVIDNYANGSVNKFAEMIKIKQQTLNRLFNIDTRTNKYPTATTEIVVAITEIFVEVSPDWLLTGRGKMFKSIGLMSEEESDQQDADVRAGKVMAGEAVPSDVLNNPSYQNLLNKIQEQADEITTLNIELKDAYKEISTLQKELRTAEKR